MNEIRKGLGSRIRLVRKRLGLNQRDFGAILGVGISAVSAYESGGASPPPESLAKIAKQGGVSIDYLINGQRDKAPRDKFNALSALLNEYQFHSKGNVDQSLDPHENENGNYLDGKLSPQVFHNKTQLELGKDEFTLISLFRQISEKNRKEKLIDLAYIVAIEKQEN